MNRIDSANSILVLVDLQQRLMPAIDGGAAVVANAVFLGQVARLLGIRVLGTEQNPAGLGPNLPEVRELCESTLGKMHFDACGDGLLDLLNAVRPQPGATPEVVIAGCEAHVCLLQTALGLRRAGFAVFVVAPACGSRSPQDHQLAMQRLQQAGAVLVSPEMVVFEWLDDCAHPSFKPVLQLLKQRK